MFDSFTLPFFQRGIVEVLLLASVAGTLGVWIVLRGMAFYAHAVGSAAVPGLVLADGLGFSPLLGGFGAALLMAALITLLVHRRSVGSDSATAIVLAGALALGVILASDVFGSQGSVDRLLFGSLLAIGPPELALAALTAALALAATLLAGPRWLASGFRNRGGRGDALLIGLIALAAVAALAAVGALLATAILVVPAATMRLLTGRLIRWQLATAALAAAEGVAGMVLAFQLNLPPGAAIAVLSGLVFALVAVATALRVRRPWLAPAALCAAVASGLMLTGCAGGGPNDTQKLTVAATTTQLGDIVRQVGGSAVSVEQILTPNSEAHDYEPRPADVASVADAKLLFSSGLGLDRWSAKLVEQSGSGARVIDVGGGVPVKRHLAGGATDPHWWQDLANVAAATTQIERALIAADPRARELIIANARAYRAKLRSADRAISACINRIAPSRRLIVTDHDAFVYYTSRYGLRSVGAIFPSTSTQSQASAGEVAALEAKIKALKVAAIFPESSLNRALADRIASDTGASSNYQLYGDTLGPRTAAAGTLIGAALANTQAIVGGISGGRVRCLFGR